MTPDASVSTAPARDPRGRALPILLSAYALYLAFALAQTSFVIDGVRWFCLFDDAMISMRYAKNLVSGAGLVFNPGERVEGFTNPLWTLLMAAAHVVVPDRAKVSLLVQVASALCLLANLALTWRLAERLAPRRPEIRWSVTIATAAFYPLIHWAIYGMEVGAVTALVTGACLAALDALERGRWSARPYVLLAIATLVRPDALVLLGPLLLLLVVRMPGERLRHLATGAALAFAVVALPTAARLAYYGEWVPNTYVLKVQGIATATRVSYGLQIFLAFAQNAWFVPLWGPLLGLVAGRRSAAVQLLALLVGIQFAYSIYVGGDAWEGVGIGANRFVSTVAPLVLLLTAYGLSAVFEWVAANLEAAPRALVRMVPALVAACVLASGGAFGLLGSRELLARLVLAEPAYFQPAHETMTRYALRLSELAEPRARIAVTWAGIVPYFTGLYTIDLLGKVDPYVAKLPMRPVRSAEGYQAGHMKWDLRHSLVDARPDVIVQTWEDTQEVRALVESSYVADPSTGLLLRRDSPYVRIPPGAAPPR